MERPSGRVGQLELQQDPIGIARDMDSICCFRRLFSTEPWRLELKGHYDPTGIHAIAQRGIFALQSPHGPDGHEHSNRHSNA
jgi:hypothetical protein